jgi:hypothetical protein
MTLFKRTSFVQRKRIGAILSGGGVHREFLPKNVACRPDMRRYARKSGGNWGF